MTEKRRRSECHMEAKLRTDDLERIANFQRFTDDTEQIKN